MRASGVHLLGPGEAQVVRERHFLIMSKSQKRMLVTVLVVASLAVGALTGCSQPQAPASPPQVGMSPATVPGSPGGQASASHKARGTIKAITADRLSVTIDHGAIPSIPMEPMSMDYKMKTARVLEGIKAGDSVDFVLVSESDGYVVTSVKKAAQ